MRAAESILIIEDDAELAQMVCERLAEEGYDVTSVDDGKLGLDAARNRKPNLILLDITLPGLNGLEVCKELRRDAQTRSIPIIMVTAHSDDVDVTVGLEVGADDYVGKPFSLRQLIARIRALLRRSSELTPTPRPTPTMGNLLLVDQDAHLVQYQGKTLSLTQAEFHIIATLTAAPGHTFTRDQLINRITKDGEAPDSRNIDVHVNALRKKLGEGRSLIETVRGVGYRYKG